MSEIEQLPPNPADEIRTPDLTGHRPTEIVLQQLFQFAFGNLRKAATNPLDTTFENIFQFFSSAQLVMIKKFFAENKIDVRTNFPKYEYPLPIVAIHSREEQESAETWMNHEEIVVDNADGSTRSIVGQLIDQTLDVIVITDDPQLTLMVYRLVWYVIFSNKFDLEEYANFHALTMQGTALNFDAQTFPNWQYSRVITLRLKTIFDFYLEAQRPPKAVMFSGLYAQVGEQEKVLISEPPENLIVEEEEEEP